MSSNWPPHLKAWVQQCLSQATPANKAAVSAELKQVLFDAHKQNTIDTTDWSNVQLQSLQAQTKRVSYVPNPPKVAPAVIPPPPTVSSYPTYAPPPSPPTVAYNPYASSTASQAPLSPVSVKDESTSGKKKKAKGSKNKKKSIPDFPSAYEFTGVDDSEALARRQARFSQAQQAHERGPIAQPVGVNGWFDADTSGGFSQGGKKRLRGMGSSVFVDAPIAEEDPNVIDWDRFTIKGTSNRLEKRYLRLTSEPDPAEIRPLHVLEQSLKHVVAKWKEQKNYAYAVDQFKSMRQDLTVQRIKNEFTVKVYEYHARVALEAKDLGEYNQCQTMLRQLYDLGIRGHVEEFLSYRILYLLHTRNRSEMAALLPKLTSSNKADPGVHHALQVAAAVATSNYLSFFRLFENAPNMSGFIMDHFVERERMSALAIISKSHMTLTLSDITKLLAFDTPDNASEFLSNHDVGIYTNPHVASSTAQPSTNAWRSIKAPVPTPLRELVWDCKKAAMGVRKGMEKYRVVDLKGQVN